MSLWLLCQFLRLQLVTRGTTTVVGIHSGGYNSNWDQACKVSDYIVGWVEERIGL